MVMADEKGKRPRTRAPVSCLNCKRRKVRCDKGRPCGGCVRNNVGHLCVYVDPKWADSSKKVAENGGLEMAPGMTQQDTLRMDLERQIEAQNREIQCLRARLAHASSTSENGGMGVGIRQNQNVINGNGTSSPPSSANKPDHSLLELMREMSHKKVPMTILAKLSGRPSQPKPMVSQDALFSINGFRGGGTGTVSESAEIAPTTIYSWLNIVKVDPQLTALWFRITSLQKTYHMYKTTLLKNGNKSGQHTSLSSGSSVKPKTGNSNMNTNSEDPTNTDHKCPVVAYEFNLMLEESPSPGPQEKPVCPMKIETSSSPTGPIHGATRGEDALEILGAIQGLWAEIVGGSLGTTHELTYTQIEDLVEKYMVGSIKVDSRHILRFFRAEICGLFSQNGTKPRLEVGSFSPHMSDAEVLDSLRSKAIYMAMLALVIEETRSGTNSRTDSGTDSGSTSSGIYVRVLGLVHSIFRSNTRVVSENSSLAALSLFVCVLNRLAAIYDASPSSSLEIDVRDAYTGIFVLLFETLFQDSGKGQLQIWCDPAHVSIDDDAVPQTELGVLLCGLWADTLRHANIAVLAFVPILRHGTQIDNLLGQLLDKVPVVAASQTHVVYLASDVVKSLGPHVKTVLFNIQTQYLVCRATSLLRNGIGGDVFERRVALADFSRMATEMAEWQKTCAKSEFGSCPIRAFEATLMLKYGFLFFTAVAFLQCEENGDCDSVALILPGLFDAYIELTRFLQASGVQFAQIHGSGYVWAAVGETLARISHLVAGLLIRFKPDSTSSSTSVLIYTPKHAKTPKPVSIPVARKEALLREGDRTVEVFESTMGPKLARSRTKIWKFYQTFLRNSHKTTPPAYVQAHADALGAGRFLDRCPIMSGSNYETSAARMEVGKCPVFHGDMGKPGSGLGPGSRPASVSNSAPRVSGCPVSGMSDMGTLSAPRGLKPDPDSKRCPYGHGSSDNVELVEPSRKRRWPYNDSTDPRIEDSPRRDSQNLLLSRLSKYTPPLCVPMASPIPLPSAIPAPPIIAPAIPTPVPVNDSFSSAPFVDMDWDSLPNFNFDMMEDEALMGQLNSGDFNNPLIEGLFQ